MSLIEKLETDIQINSQASKYYEIIHMKPYLIPKISEKMPSCTLIEGEWGKVGSIIKSSYFYDGRTLEATDLVEEIDEKHNLITFKVIGGQKLEYFKSLKAKLQCIPKDDKGSAIRWTFEYENFHDKISDDTFPNMLMNFLVALSKDLDAHFMEIEGIRN